MEWLNFKCSSMLGNNKDLSDLIISLHEIATFKSYCSNLCFKMADRIKLKCISINLYLYTKLGQNVSISFKVTVEELNYQ